MAVSFGLRVPTQGKPQDTAAYAARVEGAGLDFLWTPDTPLLAGRWQDVYVHLTCAALATTTLRLGPGVTNPLTRHPVTTASILLTLDEASDGRADLVAGTGYSSAYIIGQKAATLATMRRAVTLWAAFSRDSLLNWAVSKSPCPTHIRACPSIWQRVVRKCWS